MRRLMCTITAAAACLAFVAVPVQGAPAPSEATQFRIVKAPRFAPAGTVVRVGQPVTRVIGDYGSGVPFEGFRLRDGKEVAGGYQASYTPVQADAGKKLVYGERARDPKTGKVITAYSAPVTVLPASSPKPTGGEVDTMITDMTRNNDIALGDIRKKDQLPGRLFRGAVVMGNVARGTNTPQGWRNNLINKQFASGALWKAITPWMYITPGPGNKAVNTRVHVSRIKLHVLRNSGTWHKVQETKLDGSVYDVTLTGQDIAVPNIRYAGDSAEVLPPKEGLFHGYGNLMDYDTSGIRAVHVQLEAKLVRGEARLPDDRAKAQYLVQVGADYYPDKHALIGRDPRWNLRSGSPYNPGVGLSRAKIVDGGLKKFNFVTLTEAPQEPGGGISAAELRKNPPPVR